MNRTLMNRTQTNRTPTNRTTTNRTTTNRTPTNRTPLCTLKPLDWIYPPRCIACKNILPIEQKRQRALSLCAPCEKKFIPLTPPLCTHCGGPTSRAGLLCTYCKEKTPVMDGNYATYAYANLIRDLFHAMKFRSQRPIAVGFGALLADHCVHHPTHNFIGDYDLLVPVPIHPRKRHARGFNQAELLAKALAPALTVPLAIKLLHRTRNTLPQSGLTPAQRKENIHNAFAFNDNFDIRDKKIGLIDDIYTTGATMDACAAVLKQHGAASVFGITFSVAVSKNYDN